jgi:hypothetical protein
LLTDAVFVLNILVPDPHGQIDDFFIIIFENVLKYVAHKIIMKEVVTKNNPTPQSDMYPLYWTSSKAGTYQYPGAIYAGAIVPASRRAFQSEPPVRSVKS